MSGDLLDGGYLAAQRLGVVNWQFPFISARKNGHWTPLDTFSPSLGELRCC